LSRHRKIKCSRSKAVALVAAGAFTVATATAAAATWPAAPGGPSGTSGTSGSSGSSGPVAGRADEAGAGALLTVTGQRLQLQAFDQSTASQADQAYQLRDQAAELSAAHWQAARAQAARKLAATKAAAATAAQNIATENQGTATAQAAASAQPATASAAPVASGSPQQIARAMLASFGWSSSQFSCLDPLWAHESGWSVTAYNAGSGAYGIPQALPGSRMASAGPDWQNNAATQIRWGLEYIKGTYGSPCAAWDHEQATGWY
jgi:hypothetical protein